jgi:drug/metabolite transporter (DMT)-like permease
MIAFAGNSLLCRLALKNTSIDPASFTSVRLIAGALTLWLLVRMRHENTRGSGTWVSALALFAYAAAFSFAYVSLPAGIGALLLFGAVQMTMISYGFWAGERLRMTQIAGLVLALAGLVGLLLPGLTAPPLLGSMLMIGAGMSWGVYSLRGKNIGAPIQTTAGNFMRTIPLAVILSISAVPWISLDTPGICYAIASGAITSAIGYSIWYTALKGLRATEAAIVQLSVPIIAAIGGVVFLGEHVTLRVLITASAILGGIALVVRGRA